MVTSRRNFCSALARKAYQREETVAIHVATRSYSRASTDITVSPAVIEGLAQPTTSSGAHPPGPGTPVTTTESKLISRHRRSPFRHGLLWCQVIFCGEWCASPGPGQQQR